MKRNVYEASGIPELWLVDTKALSVRVYRRPSPEAPYNEALELTAADALTSPQLPGFSLRVLSLFDR